MESSCSFWTLKVFCSWWIGYSTVPLVGMPNYSKGPKTTWRFQTGVLCILTRFCLLAHQKLVKIVYMPFLDHFSLDHTIFTSFQIPRQKVFLWFGVYCSKLVDKRKLVNLRKGAPKKAIFKRLVNYFNSIKSQFSNQMFFCLFP